LAKIEDDFEFIRLAVVTLGEELLKVLPDNVHVKSGVDATLNELLVLEQNFTRISSHT